MKALVFQGKVVEVRPDTFPVHPSMEWVDCDDTTICGDLYENGQFTKAEAT